METDDIDIAINATEELSLENDKLAAEGIINQLRKSKKIHDAFAKQFDSQYHIAGKLMAEWKGYFKIHLPPDMNPQTCQVADRELMGLHQEATFLKAAAETRLAAYRNANDERYRSKYAALVSEYKQSGQKLPAKDTLTALAEYSLGSMKDAVVHAEIELSFWKEILNDLSNSRKLIENVTINLASEAKALHNERYIDSLNRRSG